MKYFFILAGCVASVALSACETPVTTTTTTEETVSHRSVGAPATTTTTTEAVAPVTVY